MMIDIMKKYVLKALITLAVFHSTVLTGQKFPVDTLVKNGSLDSRINIVILGDGYQESEMGKFIKDAELFMEEFFVETPYKEYFNYFNVFAIRTPSKVSGAARDPAMPIENYFGSTFNYFNIDRLLVPLNNSRISLTLANNFPQYDQVLMLVNDSKYGGSGGWIATTSTHSAAGQIAIHEIGHSFSNLADEYYAGDVYARESPNMTRETNPELVKWKNWLHSNGVGIYQHCCNDNSSQWYKPHNNCMMERLGVPFCHVCRQETVKRIHQLTDPIIHYFPVEPYLIASETEMEFFTEVVEPNPNTISRIWSLNGEIISTQNDTIFISSGNLNPGINSLSYTLTDETQMVRIDGYDKINVYQILWEIDLSTTSIELGESVKERVEILIYPNPAQDVLQISSPLFKTGSFAISIFDLQGKLIERVASVVQQDMNSLQLDISHLNSGIYVLHLSSVSTGVISAGKWTKM